MPVAFVGGATGFTGREVVRLLRSRKIDTIAHVRPDSSRLPEWRERFERVGVRIDTTPWEPDAIAQTLAAHTPDVVFGLLGTTNSRASREARTGVSRDQNSYETVDYGMTMMLVQALDKLPGRRRFVYLSAMGVKADRNAYYDARWRVETELQQTGLEWVIARPSWITGSNRDEARPGERIGAGLTDVALGLAGLLGARALRDRYRSTTNTALGAALVHHGLEPSSNHRILSSEELRDYGPTGA
jgi:nucleoside-diphosphate-sugar epimerase